MGTEIDLKVGSVTLDWSKNSIGIDHGALFQEGDLTHIRSDQTDYEYCEEHSIDTESGERAFVRSLRTTVSRLDLLGFTVAAAKAQYEALVTEHLRFQEELREPDSAYGDTLTPMLFSEFIDFLARHPINTLDNTFVSGFGVEDTARIRDRFSSDPAFGRIPGIEMDDGYSETSFFASLIGIFHPYLTMRLLALVPANLDQQVVWHYGPLVDSGWAKEDDFIFGARREQTFLIATEGSSDVHILNHAISLLMPELRDFFKFIDVSDRHPFSGTGSLVKFAEGLVKIDVQNKTIFLFDNDAEGWSAFEEVQRYKLPSNMRTMVLPDLEEFQRFETLGPHGIHKTDINRRAAAIECYLDLRLEEKSPARVTWTNYKKDRQVYQGSLDYKESYMKLFMSQTIQTVSNGDYDVTKLRIVLNHIFNECCAVSARL